MNQSLNDLCLEIFGEKLKGRELTGAWLGGNTYAARLFDPFSLERRQRKVTEETFDAILLAEQAGKE